MVDQAFADLWQRLLDRLAAREQGLVGIWTVCRIDLESILELQSHPDPDGSTCGGLDISSYKEARWRLAKKLLIDPVGLWERLQPYSRALAALENHNRSLEEMESALPPAVWVTGAEVVRILEPHAPPGWRGLAAGLRRRPFPFPYRLLVARALGAERRIRSRIEGEYLLAFALAAHNLKDPWEDARAALDASILEAGPAAAAAVPAVADQNAFRTRIQEADAALERWQGAARAARRRLARRLTGGVLREPMRRKEAAAIAGTEEADLRAEPARAIRAELSLEAALARCEDRVLDLFRDTLGQLESELTGLSADLEGVAAWLRRESFLEHGCEFPRVRAEVVPAASRLADLDVAVKEASTALPHSVQILTRFFAEARHRLRWREYHPRAALLEAYRQAGRADIASLLGEIAEAHQSVLLGIERASQVVGFAAEMNAVPETAGSPAIREAMENALSLLEFLRSEPPDWRQSADARLTRILASIFVENRMLLNRRRLGLVSYLIQQGIRRALLRISRRTLVLAGNILRRLWRAQEKASQRFLVSIGWKRAPTAGTVQVVTRPHLPEELTVEVDTGKLSALYQYLFRAEAVQDPRFLVGREPEMTAIAGAREFWEQGRPAALIIVGERGSGKTSLINCALKKWLNDLEIAAAEFRKRIVSGSQLLEALARLTGADGPAAVVAALRERRRVIILEGLERLFVRRVGGFDAIRELRQVIAATCSTVFWIASVNQVAFQFLDAAVGLGEGFSHRINAGGVSREDLQKAILLRHHLSGLRTHFPAPPPAHKLHGRLRARLEGRADAESVFFEMLASRSSGVYRSAFNIWVGQVEAIQAGALDLKGFPLEDPAAITEDLNQDQLFTLIAILQHGGLTPEEHAEVFQEPLAASRARMDELVAREVIEADPRETGFRVRPEAMPLVKEALYRRNLL